MNQSGHVLVVEDDDLERKALITRLKSEGFTVFGAESADKAFSYVDEEINVVLSDLHMGDVSGIDLLNLWKQRKPDTHFIVLTGETGSAAAVQAMKAGAYDYINKPINVEELAMLIKRAIDSTRKEREIEDLRRRLDQSSDSTKSSASPSKCGTSTRESSAPRPSIPPSWCWRVRHG